MLKPDQIPDEVWHTAMSTYHKTIRKNPGKAWQEAIAAALNAWPEMTERFFPNDLTRPPGIFLPLPKEPVA